jgi:hypothetical protein
MSAGGGRACASTGASGANSRHERRRASARTSAEEAISCPSSAGPPPLRLKNGTRADAGRAVFAARALLLLVSEDSQASVLLQFFEDSVAPP